MKVKNIKIKDVGGVKSADLHFDPRMNIICGYNGVGKTTILECIAHAFSTGFSSQILTRNATAENGEVVLVVEHDKEKQLTESYQINHFSPNEDDWVTSNQINNEKLNLITLKIERYLDYVAIDAIKKDDKFTRHQKAQRIIQGAKTEGFKSWFLNRHLYSKHEGSLNNEQRENLKLAKEFFSILDDRYGFSRVIAADNEIMINTPSGEIYFEYLSSGFKSCLAILFTIIKEIELLSLDKKDKAIDFDGIVLIDEPEIHLHPSWQYKIRDILLSAFPKAQFICATHSPHIVQSCNQNEVISLISKDGFLYKNDLFTDSEYGFKGWTVEEILSDVMGMSDLRTELYKSMVRDFYAAIDEENKSKAIELFNEINKILHPENMDRKIFKIDLSLLTGGEND
ncbi:AAA family ATPase [Providencia rettgeri]|uniref:AAA family ATPase n=1 Tax=Providencia rettgeri TaxID=587 RepID=UPI001BA536DA|nr:AAA family ATPase [Providencia rettgeri]MBS0861928.1 AAA family ATPase [Providencia rettgeri]MBS0875663.1 AAA family ATPase [Providencia rettgeri]MBS0922797.1 AAA family ATPase [Providencia rettgeri]